MNKLRTLSLLSLAMSSSAFALVNAGLVGFYDFEGNANDKSGNGNHGSIISGTEVTLTNSGYEGQAYDFSGSNTNSYISLPIDINPSAMPDFTMGAWVNADSVAASVGILSHDNGGFDRTLGTDNRGSGTSTDWSAFTGSGVIDTNVVATTGSWVFLAMTVVDGGDVTLYVQDSATTISSANTSESFGTGDTSIEVGGNVSFSAMFDGQIDNVFVYDRALAGSEITEIFEGGASAIPEPNQYSILFGLVAILAVMQSRARRLRGRLIN